MGIERRYKDPDEVVNFGIDWADYLGSDTITGSSWTVPAGIAQVSAFSQRLEEIGMQADIAESAALYKTYTTGITWVDALNGTVRPVIAYAFFVLYATVKFIAYAALPDVGVPFVVVYDTLWTQDDAAIFAGIISFYFGQRAMSKLRK
jgi:hypothetical protein